MIRADAGQLSKAIIYTVAEITRNAPGRAPDWASDRASDWVSDWSSDNARAKLGQYAVSSDIAAAPATVELIPPRKTPLLCLCPLDLALAHHLADRPVLRLV